MSSKTFRTYYKLKLIGDFTMITRVKQFSWLQNCLNIVRLEQYQAYHNGGRAL